jgi:hypothetical protein
MARRQGARGAASAEKPDPARRPTWHLWLRVATVTAMCCVVAALFAPFDLLLPVVTVPLVVGACAGIWERRPAWAAGIGAVGSLAGSWTVLSAYELQSFVDWAQTRMPQYTMQDTTLSVLDFIVATTAASPLSVAQASGRGVLLGVALMAFTAGVAAVVAWWRTNGVSKWPAAIASWMVVVLLAGCFAYTAWTGTVPLRASISSEPPDLSYAYDPVFNVKTYYMMRRGRGFYDAYLYAQSRDARKASPRDWVNGRPKWGSAVMMREPAAFFLWRVVGAGSIDAVIALSIAACVALLASAFMALRRLASTRALFVVAMLYPGLMLHTVWLNIFFPDWWAALCILGSVLLLIGRRYLAAGAAAFLAIVFRETAGAWALVLLASSAFLWLRGDAQWRGRTIGYAARLLGGMAAFGLHYVVGQQYFPASPPKTFNLAAWLGSNAGNGLDWKLMSATSYLMQPYGLYAVPTLLMLPAASAGFWLALPDKSLERLALTIYPTMMLLYFLTIGATSQYWGQIVMPIGIIGTGLLLARADLLVAQLVSRGRHTGSDQDD